MRKCSANFGKIVVSRLRGLGTDDLSSMWLKKLNDIAVNREQCRPYCNFLSNKNDWKSALVQLGCHLLATAAFLFFPICIGQLPVPLSIHSFL